MVGSHPEVQAELKAEVWGGGGAQGNSPDLGTDASAEAARTHDSRSAPAPALLTIPSQSEDWKSPEEAQLLTRR